MLGIVFPHQLFKELPTHWKTIWFVRHDIGYGGKHTTVTDFHVNRKIFLRVAEKAWVHHIQTTYKINVRIIDRNESWTTNIACEIWDPVDQMLEAEIKHRCPKATLLSTPAFLLTEAEAKEMLETGKRASHATFYEAMRKEYNVLVTASGGPEGGRWRFDTENRLRIPKGLKLPDWEKEIAARQSEWIAEAAKEIKDGLGERGTDLVFPTTHEGATAALHRFLQSRLTFFGPYEDAITAGEKPANDFHFHSVLSAAINIGLLTPDQVLVETIGFAEKHKVPLASLEGFVAQILGWREYMRAVYLRFPTPPPNRLNHQRSLSDAWYKGETGLVPVDTAIRRVNRNAYLHHIERLMIVGNAMFLCEIRPTDVYRWFMEMFADSWDWVMVGNVYYMSQWASDAITTKPYISSSAYVLRMSDYKRGEWCGDWDALYWSAIDRLAPLLKKNYRMAAQVSFWNKKSAAEKKEVRKRVLEVQGRL